jgi:hypothetical protein
MQYLIKLKYGKWHEKLKIYIEDKTSNRLIYGKQILKLNFDALFGLACMASYISAYVSDREEIT